jgi:hypothetical protein
MPAALPNAPILDGNAVFETALNGTEIGRITVSDPATGAYRLIVRDGTGATFRTFAINIADVNERPSDIFISPPRRRRACGGRDMGGEPERSQSRP